MISQKPSSSSRLIPCGGHTQSQHSRSAASWTCLTITECQLHLQTHHTQWIWNQHFLCTCHAQQVVRVISSSPLQCRWILHLCWGQFISIINTQRSIHHLKNTTCQKLCLYTVSEWGANLEFVIHVGDPDGSMTLTRILHEYCIKIKMDSLWPSTRSRSRSLCDWVPFLIIEIIFSSIPFSLPLQWGKSHWDQSPV